MLGLGAFIEECGSIGYIRTMKMRMDKCEIVIKIRILNGSKSGSLHSKV
jgi:hypothetical protein